MFVSLTSSTLNGLQSVRAGTLALRKSKIGRVLCFVDEEVDVWTALGISMGLCSDSVEAVFSDTKDGLKIVCLVSNLHVTDVLGGDLIGSLKKVEDWEQLGELDERE